jgi:RHS repeat-associated protein
MNCIKSYIPLPPASAYMRPNTLNILYFNAHKGWVGMRNISDYSPFGALLPERTTESAFYRNGFQGQERDDEVKGEGNSVNFKYRMHDPRVGRFFAVDPLAAKFAGWSPYAFCYNSPINVIDPDGREGIVVSGSPGDHNNREHFLVNGLDRAKAAKKHTQREGEIVTWIIYDDKENGYTTKQLKGFRKKAEAAGIQMRVVSDVDVLVDYVNDKNGGNSREKDQITSFYYVGHATPGDLDVGYSGSGEDFEPDDFDSDAFSSGCHVNLVGGCRTAIPGVFEDSNVTQFTEILDEKSTVYGSDVRVYYSGGVMSDSDLVKKNNGNIVEKKGELPVEK